MPVSDGRLEENLARWMKGNPDAIRWCADLIEVMDVWDDLIDQDKEVPKERINAAFSTAMLWMPSNPFFQANAPVLFPFLAAAYRNWTVANEMEEAEESLPVAFVIRSSYIDALTTCAACLGGHEWAVTVNREVRRFIHREGLDGYLVNLKAEKDSRNVRKQRRDSNDGK